MTQSIAVQTQKELTPQDKCEQITRKDFDDLTQNITFGMVKMLQDLVTKIKSNKYEVPQYCSLNYDVNLRQDLQEIIRDHLKANLSDILKGINFLRVEIKNKFIQQFLLHTLQSEKSQQIETIKLLKQAIQLKDRASKHMNEAIQKYQNATKLYQGVYQKEISLLKEHIWINTKLKEINKTQNQLCIKQRKMIRDSRKLVNNTNKLLQKMWNANKLLKYKYQKQQQLKKPHTKQQLNGQQQQSLQKTQIRQQYKLNQSNQSEWQTEEEYQVEQKIVQSNKTKLTPQIKLNDIWSQSQVLQLVFSQKYDINCLQNIEIKPENKQVFDYEQYENNDRLKNVEKEGLESDCNEQKENK